MGEKNAVSHSSLYKAVLLGDWDAAKTTFDIDPSTIVAPISRSGETALHVAVAHSQSMAFVSKLADLMSEKSMSFKSKSKDDSTALHYAAMAGNTEASKIIVNKDRSLQMAKNDLGEIPLYAAVHRGHKDTTRFLFSLIQNESLSDFDAGNLLLLFIMVDFYDFAIILLKRYPHLVLDEEAWGMAFYNLAEKQQAFTSGIRLSIWQRVYHYFSSSTNEYKSPERGDIENPTEPQLQESKGVYGFLMKDVINTKLMHKQALELLKLLIAKILKSYAPNADKILAPSLILAAKNGIYEFVTEVIKAYPSSVTITDKDNHTIFDVAVIFRQERVYNLLYQLGSTQHFMMGFDKDYNNMLHLAAKYESGRRIISNAAIQMQRELQWYREVEQFVQPSYRKRNNSEGKLPATLFTESHEELVKDGKKWMMDMAQSCTIVATLVVTIVFTAAFTVPGSGNSRDNDTNSSYVLKDVAYMVFVISNALSLFSSTTSVLMFLGILTSGYSEEDFRKSLPMRLAIGLITLFFSIASMLVAFSAGVHIVLAHQVHWIAIPIGLLACIPVTFFGFAQFQLLVQIVSSTFGPSIFGKQSDELLWKLQEVPPFPSSDVNVEVHHI